MLVTVIIPVYNAERFLRESITSVLEQTYREVELILVDDGSEDGSMQICEEYARQDERIQIIRKGKTGVSDTRNAGLGKAKGDYVSFLDADDKLTKESIEILLKEMREKEYDAVYGNFINEYEGKQIRRKGRLHTGEYSYGELKSRLIDDGTLSGMLLGSACGALYRREVMEKNQVRFQKEIKRNEDGIFNLEFLNCEGKIKVLKETYVYIYRQWKSGNKRGLNRDKELDLATEFIAGYKKKMGNLDNFEIQMARRNVMVAFMNAIRVRNSDAGMRECIRYLQKIFEEEKVKEGFKWMDYPNMNRYKKCMCKLMEKDAPILFYLAVRYIYPMLENRVKR